MTRGVRHIVRFNWPFYAAAGVAVAVATLAIGRLPAGGSARSLAYLGSGVAMFWLVGSLAASWMIYDLSPLMRWQWIRPALGFQPRAWVNIHVGLDESTPALRGVLAGSTGRAFDIFDPVEMTESSILRARRLGRLAVDAEAADFGNLPAHSDSIDAAMLLLSAHEVRSEDARQALFAEIHRVLSPHGRIVVAEHLRDWVNFLAFGPGVLHFHSRDTWLRCFARARLAIHSEFSITPQIVTAHNVFLILTLALLAMLLIVSGDTLLEPTRLGRAVLIGLTLVWGLRMLMQWWFYSPTLWRGHRLNTRVHYLFSAVWVYVTAVFAAALWRNLSLSLQ
jgi:SAM-dependent methyltransferase